MSLLEAFVQKKKIGIFKIEKADDASQTIFFCLVTIFSERETLKMKF